MVPSRLPAPRPARPYARLMAFFPNALAGVQVSYTCASLAEPLAREVETRIYAHALIKGYRHPLAIPALPPAFTRWGYRYLKRWLPLQQRLEQRYLTEIGPEDLGWVWPGRIVPTLQRLSERGVRTVVETINCHQATARRILDDAYRRLGWAPQHGLTDDRIAAENEAYDLADAVFSPHPCATAALIEQGVPEQKIIPTSFGWAPHLMPTSGSPVAARQESSFTALFVGTLCVRKGAHLLVRAWRDAGVTGTLRMIGWMADDFRGREEEYLAAPGVQRVGPIPPDQVGDEMAAADVFAFPTLEESGPQVTYEAASQGMAILTTPMGAGAIIRDGIDGVVLDPYDHDAWVQALRRLHADPDWRRGLGKAAQARADEFTWERVASRRLDALDAHFGTTR
jgi:glycosyltransferase involved in cell wall biosynthesis